jgi:N-acetylglucosaminyldiphosphoundecaprenol N-acetyl-beta-D-mannosaminyltransferase
MIELPMMLPLNIQHSSQSHAEVPPIATSDVLGVRFHCLSISSVLHLVECYIAEKRPRQLCLANAYTLALTFKDDELRRLLNQADLVLADGMSIVWGGQWLGSHIPQRVAGPDLTDAICALAETSGYRVFFLGSTADNLARLKEVLLRRWPRLQIVGMFSPPMCEKLTPEDNALIFAALGSSKPDVLFVGMSTPKQEKWIASNLKHLQVPVSVGIGAAFDFMSGLVPRAPELLQKSGFEWLYRLYCEPRRLWKRYLLGNVLFLSHLGAAWLKVRLRSVK